MSHNINYYTFPKNCNKRDVEDGINEEVCHKTYEEGGHGLYGPIRWIDSTVYPDYQAAHDAIDRLDRGNYDQLAVLYRTMPKGATSKKRDELRIRIADTSAKHNALDREIAARSFKAQYVGCKGCNSKLNREYITSNRCPVCGIDMRSDTTLARLAGYKEKLEKLNEELRKEEQKLAAKGEVKWLVKIEYHT